MSHPESTPEAREGHYLLVKRGLYYRPNRCGYTGVKSEAGRYSESEANPLSGVSAVHEDDAPAYSPNCYDDVAMRDFRKRVKQATDDLEAHIARSIGQ